MSYIVNLFSMNMMVNAVVWYMAHLQPTEVSAQSACFMKSMILLTWKIFDLSNGKALQ